VTPPAARVAAAGDFLDQVPIRPVQDQFLVSTDECDDGFFSGLTCLRIGDGLEPFLFDFQDQWS
jgi:hypothetical protein